MNDEIKELLDYLDYGVNNLSISKPPFKIGYEDIKKLLDYITNLQQENERIKTKTKEQSLLLIDYQDMEQKLEDYKSRCEKAVEYIGEYKDYCDKEVCDCTPEYFENLLDILNGRSDEKSHQINYNYFQINYNYFETLYSKSTKEIVIDDLVWKCEELDNFKKEYEKLYIEKEDYKSRCERANEIAKDLKQFVYDELVGRNVCGATETHDKIINLLNTLNSRSDE